MVMLRWLWRLFGWAAESSSPTVEYDPVYGFPRRAVEEWLARNPQLREEYEVQVWLVRNPPLRKEYEAARQQLAATTLARLRENGRAERHAAAR
jgi:hypothetical protein